MSLSPQQKQELDDRWIDTLLNESYHPTTPIEEARWSQLQATLDRESKSIEPNAQWYHLQRWAFGVIAASILVLLGYNLFVTNQHKDAFAAVERCEAARLVPQEYRFQMTQQAPLGRTRRVNAKLYLDGRGRFVVEHPGWLGLEPLWIGGDSKSRWIVPRMGPAIKGGETLIGGWLARRDIPSPYLHLQTTLDRLKQAYQLELLDAGADTDSVRASEPHLATCQRVRGTIRSQRTNLPTSIELWIEKDSGLARRVIVRWDGIRRIGDHCFGNLMMSDPAISKMISLPSKGTLNLPDASWISSKNNN